MTNENTAAGTELRTHPGTGVEVVPIGESHDVMGDCGVCGHGPGYCEAVLSSEGTKVASLPITVEDFPLGAACSTTDPDCEACQ